MKTKYLFFAASALLAFASCSNDDFASESALGGENGSGGAIVFTSGANAITRANQIGADAASLLNNKFVVSGLKGDGTTMSTVFDNYIVNWVENTAGKTASNTSDWEYVGIDAAAPSAITGKQTVKYWDYSTSRYDFAAYSLGTNTSITTGTPTDGQILVTSIGKTNPYSGLTYTLKGAAVDLAKCYISDMVTVAKANYQKEVQLTFRSLGTKIRVGFYETVPGYSVKDVKFYTDDATTPISTGASVTSATLFMPSGTVGFGSAGTYAVSFVSNVAQVAFTMDEGASVEKQQAFGDLTYKAKEGNEKGGDIYLGRSSNNPSYAGSGYTTVLPNTATGDVLELRVDYTLESIDGSGEEIKIHGAKAFVPATYTVWKPNFTYTYIFKISDNTNGWTSTTETDPTGLYPITFDAIVTEAVDANNEQTTITTVATPSITTYQQNHDITKDEYSAATGTIYVQVMVDGTLKNDLASKGQLYKLSAAKTEADVMDALNVQVSSTETTITGRNELVLTKVASDATITTIPGEDGNNITVTAGTAASFTPAAAGTYAYVYDATPDPAPAYTHFYSAESSTTKPTDWTTTGVWYKDQDGVTAVADEDWIANKIFYKKYTNQNKVYGVKVIKVVE